jgi:SpoVK/Ycf46/Vps4 family AAA+-type ATPase
MTVWRRAFTRKRLEARRLDLTAVARRYLGETEANLDWILARASENEVALLFDEADALFGRRSEVEDSHDRYRDLQESPLVARLRALFAQQQRPR